MSVNFGDLSMYVSPTRNEERLTNGGMTCNFQVKIARDKEYESLFCISMRPHGYSEAPETMSSLTFDSRRTFPSELAAQRQVFATFGRIVKFKRNKAGELEGSIRLAASPL